MNNLPSRFSRLLLASLFVQLTIIGFANCQMLRGQSLKAAEPGTGQAAGGDATAAGSPDNPAAPSETVSQDPEEVEKLLRGEGGRVAPPRPVRTYLGRRIAETMHYEGAPWLIRNEREREERCSLMLVNLGLKPGQTVCDMGCGNGFHSLPIAQLIGAHGQVLAVDIQPEMLVLLRERMEETGVTNITPILGSAWDPHLPAAAVDLVLMVDVYHEFSHPEPMLAAIRRSLRPGGVVVLVEFRAEDPEVPIKPVHKMSKAQVDKEMTANGFQLVRAFDRLPWQHLLVYAATPDTATPDADPPKEAADGADKQ